MAQDQEKPVSTTEEIVEEKTAPKNKVAAKAKVEKVEQAEQKIVEFSEKWWETAIAILKAPFPEESYQDNTARTGNSEIGIKPQYVVERLNDAFGQKNWVVNETEREIGQTYVRMKVELLIGYFKEWVDTATGEPKSAWITLAKREGHGGMRVIKGNLPDSLKGAETDALKKAASKFDVAGEAYKGAITMAKAWSAEAKIVEKAEGIDPTQVAPQPTQKAPICPDCGERMSWRVSKRGPFWGCSMYPNCKGIVATTDVDINGNITKGSSHAPATSEERIDY